MNDQPAILGAIPSTMSSRVTFVCSNWQGTGWPPSRRWGTPLITMRASSSS